MMTYGVVVVEDEYWIRKLICSYLPAEDDGIILLGEASDGFEALSLCRRVRPRILITDIKMPEMNGLELMETILRPSEEPSDIRDQRIKRAVLFIKNNCDRDISLEEAASEAAMSPNYFSECFKKTIGIGFSDYVTARRLRKAAELLRDPKLKISQVARMSGFSDPHYFSRIFKKSTGYNPGQCRNSDEIQ